MQDVRIRVAAASILSIAAFISIPGAVAAVIWWFVFSSPVLMIKKIIRFSPVFALIIFFSAVLEFTGGDGISYLIRMSVVVLIGVWMYSEYRPGDFLNFCVWLLGNKKGFDAGMVAEMGMQALETLLLDIDHIRIAERLKGLRWGVHALIPTGVVLVQGSIARAEDSAELLAVRGYCGGGTLRPEFKENRLDVFAGITAIFVLITAFIPVSEFFILYR